MFIFLARRFTQHVRQVSVPVAEPLAVQGFLDSVNPVPIAEAPKSIYPFAVKLETSQLEMS